VLTGWRSAMRLAAPPSGEVWHGSTGPPSTARENSRSPLGCRSTGEAARRLARRLMAHDPGRTSSRCPPGRTGIPSEWQSGPPAGIPATFRVGGRGTPVRHPGCAAVGDLDMYACRSRHHPHPHPAGTSLGCRRSDFACMSSCTVRPSESICAPPRLRVRRSPRAPASPGPRRCPACLHQALPRLGLLAPGIKTGRQQPSMPAACSLAARLAWRPGPARATAVP
jgi:hypothetical protein